MKFGEHDIPEDSMGLVGGLITQRWRGTGKGINVSIISGDVTFGATYEAWAWPMPGYVYRTDEVGVWTFPRRFNTTDEVGAYITAHENAVHLPEARHGN